MGLTEAEAKKFGFLLEAFEYSTPPHGGIAWLRSVGRMIQPVPQYAGSNCFPEDDQRYLFNDWHSSEVDRTVTGGSYQIRRQQENIAIIADLRR